MLAILFGTCARMIPTEFVVSILGNAAAWGGAVPATATAPLVYVLPIATVSIAAKLVVIVRSVMNASKVAVGMCA